LITKHKKSLTDFSIDSTDTKLNLSTNNFSTSKTLNFQLHKYFNHALKHSTI
jgi:hypothetical protein